MRLDVERMTLLAYTGLVLTLATIHEYVPYKCSLSLIIAIVVTLFGFSHCCSIWTMYFISLLLLGGLMFIVVYIASLSSYSIKYWMVNKYRARLNTTLVMTTVLPLARYRICNFIYCHYLSSIWECMAYIIQLTMYSMWGYMAVLVLMLSLCLIIATVILSSYMPIREF